MCNFYGRKVEEEKTAALAEPGPPAAEKPRPAWNPETARFEEKKKEGKVALSSKEMILARVTREKLVAKSRFMQYDRIPAAEIDRNAAELEAEGKIKIWRNGRALSCTLPDGKSPWGSEKAVPKKTEPATRGPVVRNRKPPGGPPPKNGGGRTETSGDAIAAALAALRARREKIDKAIETLQALA